MDAPLDKPRRPVRTVGAAKLTVELLRCLARQRGPVGVTPLAKKLGRYPGTVYTVLKTLQAEGVVEFNPASKTYQLCLGGILELSNLSRQEELPRRLEPRMREIAEQFEVSVMLSQRVRPDALVIVACAVPESPFGLVIRVGHRYPVPVGASGRLLVGAESLEEAHLRAAYEGVVWRRNRKPYAQWAAQVMIDVERGHAYEEDSLSEGLASMVVPVPADGGQISHLCSAIAARGAFPAENRPGIITALKELAETARPYV